MRPDVVRRVHQGRILLSVADGGRMSKLADRAQGTRHLLLPKTIATRPMHNAVIAERIREPRDGEPRSPGASARIRFGSSLRTAWIGELRRATDRIFAVDTFPKQI
jgi:hypothetical protein